jgi:hypothetical protein
MECNGGGDDNILLLRKEENFVAVRTVFGTRMNISWLNRGPYSCKVLRTMGVKD